MTAYAFGPLVYRLGGEGAAAAPRAWDAFRLASDAPGRAVTVTLAPPPADAPARRAAVARRDTHDEVRLAVAPGEGPEVLAAAFSAAMADLVVRDAVGHGAVVLHAAGVRVGDGAALLVAPSGTGKSTRARAAGARRFTYNGALVRPAPMTLVWPLPFAREHDGVLTDVAPLPLRAILRLQRAEEPWIECLTGAHATMTVLRAVVRPEGHDCDARGRAELAFALARCVWVGQLGSPPDGRYVDHIERLFGRRET